MKINSKGTEILLPDDLLYARDHCWAKIEGAHVRVGVTDYIQKRIGKVTMVELRWDEDLNGAHFKQVLDFPLEREDQQSHPRFYGEGEWDDQPIDGVSVESSSMVMEILPPFSGTVVDVNGSLEDRPELINSDPYGEGWLFVIEADDIESERRNLLSVGAYVDFLKTE
ncbi:MAG: glycine cleavage system protein H [Promethearchaeota archaeon]|nr:MAG: glycine cleavage system protein H [Candidatus Lokiarchaeota archaeon]